MQLWSDKKGTLGQVLKDENLLFVWILQETWCFDDRGDYELNCVFLTQTLVYYSFEHTRKTNLSVQGLADDNKLHK